MTLATWKEQFYRVPADSPEAKARPITHSLQKWKGLRQENRDAHGLDGRELLLINDASCALCELHLDFERGFANACGNCPLHTVRGRSCDSPRTASPYTFWIKRGDPEPMIALLEQALKQFPEAP